MIGQIMTQPYMVKTYKNLLLWNQWTDGLKLGMLHLILQNDNHY